MRGTYIGPLAHLRGHTALLREPSEDGYVLAQFDQLSLTRTQDWRHACITPDDSLGLGWHRFKASDFKVDE